MSPPVLGYSPEVVDCVSEAFLQHQLREAARALATARAELAASEHLLAQALHEASEGLLLVDAAQRVHQVNEALCGCFGLSTPPACWVGQPVALLVAELRQQLADPAALDHLLAHPAPGYHRLPLCNQQAVAVQVRPLPTAAGGGYLLSTRPAPAAPPQAGAQAILDALPAAVLVRDAQGHVVYQNLAMQQLAHEALADPAGLTAFSAEAPPLMADTCLSLGAEETCWLRCAHGVVPAVGSEPPLAVVVGTDITDLKRTQQALQQARDGAEAATQAREAFLATMSHEIRTPLTGVLGMADQLANTPLDGQQRQLLSIMRTSGHFLLSVLNETLDMSQVTSGKLALAHVPFEFCALVHEALAPLAWQATQKGLDFQLLPVGGQAPYPWVLGDDHRLRQVLVNLVGNALKFTAQGFVHVRSQVLARTADALTLQIEVADSGIGMAAGEQAHVFDLFAQASPAIRAQYGGSGLGLGICRALVQHMGGTLSVASQPGAGSTFTFTLTLPLAVPDLRPALPATSAPRAGTLAGLRVLLVDDNEISRGVARYLLLHWGATVHEASSGAEALALFADHPVEVVLLDIEMPGLSGLEVLAQLRQHSDSQRAATPVIAFTANAFRADTERYLAAGFAAHLAKPFGEEGLYQQLVGYCPVAAPGIPDLTYLHTQAHGNEALITKIINAFLRNTPPLLLDLRAAVDAGRWAAAASLVHHLRSNMQVLGIRAEAGCLAVLQGPLPAGPGPAAQAFARAARQLADGLATALRVLPGYLP